MSDRYRHERQLCQQCGQKLKPAPRATFRVLVAKEGRGDLGRILLVPDHLEFRDEDELQTWLRVTRHKITRRNTMSTFTGKNGEVECHSVRAIDPALGWDGKGFFHSQTCATAWATRTCGRLLNGEE